MEAVTFPQDSVVEFIEKNVVPVRLPHDHEPLAREFDVKWTPTLVVLDESGDEHYRTVGFLSAEELVASLKLGLGKTSFDADRFEEAVGWFDQVVDGHPSTSSVPEAIFYRAVAQFKTGHDPAPLKTAYEELEKRFPENEWTKRAYPYRLL